MSGKEKQKVYNRLEENSLFFISAYWKVRNYLLTHV